MASSKFLIALVSLVIAALPNDYAKVGEVPNPYRADFEAALDAATSDFEREVLADFEITRAEYEEAVARYVQCAHSNGLELTAVPQGDLFVYQLRGKGTPEVDTVLDKCSRGTTAQVEWLYGSVVRNPGREDWGELLVECLKRHRLVADDYTTEQYQADSERRA